MVVVAVQNLPAGFSVLPAGAIHASLLHSTEVQGIQYSQGKTGATGPSTRVSL